MSPTRTARIFLVSIYPMLTAIFCGAVLIDIVYSRLLTNTLALSQKDAVFRDVSDMLLKIGFLVVLSGGAAILAAWDEKQARVLLVLSLFALFALEFLIPMLFMRQLQTALAGSLLGPILRVLANLLAAIFAVVGFERYVQSRRSPA